MHGETVVFHVTSVSGKDDMGNDTYSTTDVSVDNVLVGSGTPSDMSGTVHPQGDVSDITAYIPKGTSIDYRGATLSVPRLGDKLFEVVGKPLPLPEWLTPGEWNVVVRANCKEG